MSWTRVGGNFATSTGNRASADSGTVTCEVGDLVLWCVAGADHGIANEISAVSLTSGATGTVDAWTQVAYLRTGGDAELMYGWARVTGAGTIGLHVTAAGSGQLNPAIEVWRGGLASGDPIRDSSDSGMTVGGPGTTADSGQVTPTVGDLLVGCHAFEHTGTTGTPTSGWDERAQSTFGASASGSISYVETREDTGGVAIASQPTLSQSMNWCSALMAVKPAAGGGGGSGAPWWTRGGLNGGMQ